MVELFDFFNLSKSVREATGNIGRILGATAITGAATTATGAGATATATALAKTGCTGNKIAPRYELIKAIIEKIVNSNLQKFIFFKLNF
jgi:hypothetical protein